MNTMAEVTGVESHLAKRLENLETRLSALESKAPSLATPFSDEIPDGKLDDPRFDREVRKDPPFWAKGIASGTHVTMVGKMYSTAPSEWLTVNAGYLDWHAQKGRDERPVRLNNKGEPWHKVDAFEAKLCRAWAKRNKGKPADPAPGEREEFSDIPF